MAYRSHRISTSTGLLGATALLAVGLTLLARMMSLSFGSLIGRVLTGLAAGFGAIPVSLLIVAAIAAAIAVTVGLWDRRRQVCQLLAFRLGLDASAQRAASMSLGWNARTRACSVEFPWCNSAQTAKFELSRQTGDVMAAADEWALSHQQSSVCGRRRHR